MDPLILRPSRSQPRPRRAPALLGAVFLLAALSGCVFGGPKPAAPRSGGSAVTPALAALRAQREKEKKELTTGVGQPLGQLTQYENGPGVVVCEPVPHGESGVLAHFGRGCARWLQLTVGGHAELDRTPSWASIARVFTEQDRLKAPADLTMAMRLPKALGVTHAVVGEISGTPERCTLTYRLYQVPEKVLIGEPLTASGSPAEVVRALPDLARKLCTHLRVAAPRVPAGVEDAAADLEFYGTLPRQQVAYLTPAQKQRLEALSTRSPLAEVQYTQSLIYTPEKDPVVTHTRSLVSRAGGNTLMLETALLGRWTKQLKTEPDDASAVVTEALKSHPHNFLLHTCSSYLPAAEAYEAANADAEEAVRCSATNSEAWYRLLELAWARADRHRQDRYWRAIPPKERPLIVQLYNRVEEVAKRTVKLDPEWGDAWMKLSEVAGNQGHEKVADQAMWQGLPRALDNSHAVRWGILYYRPNWYYRGDIAKRRKVAEMGAAFTYASYEERVLVARYLNGSGYTELADKVFHSPLERRAFKAGVTPEQLSARAANPRRTARRIRKQAGEPAIDYLSPNADLLYKHNGEVFAVAWSPDGSRLASGGEDMVVRLWPHLANARDTLPGHTDTVTSLAWSPDGKRLASASRDGTLRVWEPATDQPAKVVRKGGLPLRAVAWSPDGSTLASGGDGGALQMWNAADGSLKRAVAGHPRGSIRWVGFSADGRFFAASSNHPDDSLRIFDASHGELLRRIDPEMTVFEPIGFSRTGARLATAGNNLQLWDAATGQKDPDFRQTFSTPLALAWSADGRSVAYLSGGRALHLLDITGKRESAKVADHTHNAWVMSWDPAKGVATGGTDGAVMLWKLPGTSLVTQK